MSSPPPQGNSPSPPLTPSSAPPGHLEITVDEQHVLSKLENTATFGHVSSKSGDVQHKPANLLSPLDHTATRNVTADGIRGPGDASDARSISSGRKSKLGFRKRLSRLFKGDKNVIETASASQTSCTSPIVSIVQLQPSPENGTLRLDIFPKNVTKPTLRTDLPKPHARVDKTLQLVYCCSVLSKTPGPLQLPLDNDVSQDSPLDDEENRWMQLIDPVLQDRYRWLVEQLVKAFADNPLKASDVVTEI
ncbi:hypothetical protein BGZ89_006693, partial [Linnemannia elongata]